MFQAYICSARAPPATSYFYLQSSTSPFPVRDIYLYNGALEAATFTPVLSAVYTNGQQCVVGVLATTSRLCLILAAVVVAILHKFVVVLVASKWTTLKMVVRVDDLAAVVAADGLVY